MAGRTLANMNDSWAPADPLGEALHSLRMSGMFYSRCEFSAPWGLILPAIADTLMFHVVTSGACWLEIEGAEPLPLQQGDFALVPHGQGHVLTSTPGTPGRELFDIEPVYRSDRYELLRQGGGGETTTLICGTVRFDHPAAHNLTSILPKLLRIEATSPSQAGWIQSTLRFMADEARELRPGGETVITRLADILVIQAIREWIERDPAGQSGWLGALRDKQVGRAIALIHRDPARAWSVAELADEVAMSRSAFSARFTELAGEPPMHYITRWRMHLAQTWLREDGAALAEIAFRLGYQSEAAFSRAFKRTLGVSPGAVRKRAGASNGYRLAATPNVRFSEAMY